MAGEVRLVGISTSPRVAANTEHMVREALAAGEAFGAYLGLSVQTEFHSLAGKRILPCSDCHLCIEQRRYCVIEDDWSSAVRPLIEPVPDGLIFGSPVYFFHMNALGRAFMERCTTLLKRVWEPEFPFEPPDFSMTAGGAIAVGSSRNTGIEHTMSDILHWLLLMGFVTIGGLGIGGGGWTHDDDSRNALAKDPSSLEAARLVGQKVTKTAVLLNRGATTFEKGLPFVFRKPI